MHARQTYVANIFIKIFQKNFEKIVFLTKYHKKMHLSMQNQCLGSARFWLPRSGSGSKGSNINQKLQKKTFLSCNPNLNFWKHAKFLTFLLISFSFSKNGEYCFLYFRWSNIFNSWTIKMQPFFLNLHYRLDMYTVQCTVQS